MAWRRSLLNVLSASRARHRSTLAMVAAALAKARVALCEAPSTVAAPVAASSRVRASILIVWAGVKLEFGPCLADEPVSR